MVHSSRNEDQPLSLPMKIASAGLAGCTADLFTFPLDTVKVWLMVQGEPPKTSGTTSATSLKAKPTIPTSFESSMTSKKLTPMLMKQQGIAGHRKPTSINSVIQTQLLNQQRPKVNIPGKKLVKGSVVNKANPKMRPLRSKTAASFTKFAKPQFKPLGSIRSGSGFASANQIQIPSAPRMGLVGTIVNGVRSNGFFSLYGGLAAGLQRQVAFCAVRIGLYDSVKEFYQNIIPGNSDGKQIPQRILAGTTTAFVAVGLFQPTEVVKIRMQAQTTKPKEARVYRSCMQAYRSLFQVGIAEAWKGLGTNAARLGVVNVSELVTYDIVKEVILDYEIMKDNPVCHFTSAFISGFITTVVASPIDVVKTRYMNSQAGRYKGPVDCAMSMYKGEGFRAFYKGFVPAYLRLGSWNIVMFVSYEQYKILFRKIDSNYKSNHSRKERAPYVSNIE